MHLLLFPIFELLNLFCLGYNMAHVRNNCMIQRIILDHSEILKSMLLLLEITLFQHNREAVNCFIYYHILFTDKKISIKYDMPPI